MPLGRRTCTQQWLQSTVPKVAWTKINNINIIISSGYANMMTDMAENSVDKTEATGKCQDPVDLA